MTWHLIVFAAILILTNLLWFLVLLRAQSNALETYKLIASKTMGEYSWLKKAETKVPESKKPDSGYDSVWEDEDEQG